MVPRGLAALVLLIVVALIVASAACLVHTDDGALDDCASLLAVTFGLTLTFSLGRTPERAFARALGYHVASLDPPTPPPRV